MTQHFTAAEVAHILTTHLEKQSLRVRGKIQFSGTIAYGGTQYDPDYQPVFTGATATVELTK